MVGAFSFSSGWRYAKDYKLRRPSSIGIPCGRKAIFHRTHPYINAGPWQRAVGVSCQKLKTASRVPELFGGPHFAQRQSLRSAAWSFGPAISSRDAQGGLSVWDAEQRANRT